VFTWLVLVFSVGFSMLALLTRRWGLAWLALAGSAVACPIGMLAVIRSIPATEAGDGLFTIGQPIDQQELA
jgi:hypothetical protein